MAVYQIDNKTIIHRNPDQLFSEIDGEVVMLSVDNGEYYNLNEVGTDIWKLIHKPLSFTKLMDILSSQYEIDVSICREETKSFIIDLANKNIVNIINESD